MDGDLIVKSFGDNKEVHRVHITNATTRKVERVLSGMLINMSNEYYVDDSEFDILYKEK